LLINDSPTDVALFRYALKAYALPYQVTVLEHRSEVEAFVRQAATTTHLSPPRLIIVDAMIPGMEVEDVIAAVRTVPAYQRIPVILFSFLAEAEGERRRVQCGATAFVDKPFVYKSGDLEAFVTAVITIMLRWSGMVDRQAQDQV